MQEKHHTNRQMREFLSSNKTIISQSVLDSSLADILIQGVTQQGEAFLFKKLSNSDKVYTSTECFTQYSDLSGYENTMNRFHIDDFSDEDCFIQSFAFMRNFKLYWEQAHSTSPCNICITFQNDEVCKTACFTFYIPRIDQEVYNLKAIEKFSEPFYLEYVNYGTQSD